MAAQRVPARRLHQLLGNWRGDGHSYHELSESIALLVRDGGLTPGAILPAERPLAEQLGLSRTTVSAAYERLRELGIAVSRRGSGTEIRAAGRRSPDPWGGATDGLIDLGHASPPPWHGLQRLGQRALSEHPEAFELVGYDTVGHPALRRAIAERYTRRGLPTTPDEVMVTLGAQHAIFLIARTLLRRGDRSLIESPSYPGAREALAAAGALIAELPIGLDGHDPAAALEIAAVTAPRLAYLMPDHHNPTGSSMPEELRGPLIAALTGQGSYVIADETTAELAFSEEVGVGAGVGGGAGAPAPLVAPFAAAAPHAHQRDMILTIGSLGKTVWGGLRVGWIRSTPELIARLESARRVGDLGTGTWEQVLATLALDEYDGILAERGRALAAGHRAVAEAGAAFPGWRLSRAGGGVSVWADLGEPSSTRLSRASARRGLSLPPGPRFGSPGVFERYIRLPFTPAEPELAAALRILNRAWGERGDAPASWGEGAPAVV